MAGYLFGGKITGAAGLDKQGLHVEPMQPFANRCRGELGTIIRADVIGWPVHQEQVGECFQDRFLVLFALGADCEALP